ncbi:MAG: AMP-binding protein [Streptosporangiales bacterium]|nr:AMP-binding protein [Streptosporangiales bacterium]
MFDRMNASRCLARWADVAGELEWATQWTSLYEPEGWSGHWFVGGQLNIAVNCVDRHVRAGRGDQPAIVWEGEPGDRRVLSYAKLNDEVLVFAAALRRTGVVTGDRVALHLGWLPETVVAMLACARIGAVPTVLGVELPTETLAARLADLRPKVLVTQDGAWHGGTILPLKARVDDAAESGHVPLTVVVQRTGTLVGWQKKDQWLYEFLAAPGPDGTEGGPLPTALDAGHVAATMFDDRHGETLAMWYGAAALLASAATVHRHGLSSGGVFWCAMDIARPDTQIHGIYGPLACGDTAVMYEGLPQVPTRGRAWELVQRYGVGTLVTVPSTLRQLRGPFLRHLVRRAAAPLRRVVIVGSVEEDLVEWLRQEVGEDRISVDIAWGQAETGGIALLGEPVDPDRLPDPGFAVVDEAGEEQSDGGPGELVITRPWAGLAGGFEGAGADAAAAARGRLGDGYYCTGEAARRGPDGRLEVLGHPNASKVTRPAAQEEASSPGTA